VPLVKIGENDAPILVISKKCSYTIRETWEAIRTKQPRVTWWKLISFSCAIPKHAFVVWLALQNCVSIGDRLMQWGIYRSSDMFILQKC